jgi:hypothetical protein
MLIMNTKLQSPEVDSDLQNEEEEENEERTMQNVEQENRNALTVLTLWHHLQILISLGYICQECDLLLVVDYEAKVTAKILCYAPFFLKFSSFVDHPLTRLAQNSEMKVGVLEVEAVNKRTRQLLFTDDKVIKI